MLALACDSWTSGEEGRTFSQLRINEFYLNSSSSSSSFSRGRSIWDNNTRQGLERGLSEGGDGGGGEAAISRRARARARAAYKERAMPLTRLPRAVLLKVMTVFAREGK